MMKQYYEIKSKYDDCILFFRLGDFYEMFGDDAVEAAEILDITLTSRSKGEDALPMCGIPYHSAESYIAKLNQKGKRVAVCEQVSDPKAKGIVERAVKKVLTPSTNTSDLNLEAKENQYLVVLDGSLNDLRACVADISTGEILLRKLDSAKEIGKVVNTYGSKEIVIEKSLYKEANIYEEVKEIRNILVSGYECNDMIRNEIVDAWKNHLSIHSDKNALKPALLCGSYLRDVIGYKIEGIVKIKNVSNESDTFELDQSSIINLEVFYTIADGSKTDSLIGKIDSTLTSMGGRLLRSWLIRPLKNKEKILRRQDHVSDVLQIDSQKLSLLKNTVKKIYDLDRLLSKVNNDSANPRDLIALKSSLIAVNELKEIELDGLINNLLEQIPSFDDLMLTLEKLKDEDVRVSIREGHIFKEGYNSDLDELRNLLKNGKNVLLDIQKREAEKNDISTLKLGFNKVFGYYLEVSKGKVNLVPDYFIRKQTLTNSERYITPELKEYEEKVLNAQDRIQEIEYEMYMKLLNEVKTFWDVISDCSRVIAEFDCYLCFAELAISRNFVKPNIVNEKVLHIENGRHPVIEEIVGKHNFIPNDCKFEKDLNVQIITGPNMGGKSTYLRQNALICLLAQIGSYVPASYAEVGIVDQIFSRVGASDNLSKGQSTFMVEMNETAYILAHATERSMIIMDEVGRGTSTSDGLSLAMGITDHLNSKIRGRTLFATHYHELVEHGEKSLGIKNYSIAVTHDENGRPIFLHKIVDGGINKSYGIEVAESAGIPNSVIEASKVYLSNYQSIERNSQSLETYSQKTLFEEKVSDKADQIISKLKKIDLNDTTPMQSMKILDELLKELS